jgi:hypothetical protein
MRLLLDENLPTSLVDHFGPDHQIDHVVYTLATSRPTGTTKAIQSKEETMAQRRSDSTCGSGSGLNQFLVRTLISVSARMMPIASRGTTGRPCDCRYAA